MTSILKGSIAVDPVAHATEADRSRIIAGLALSLFSGVLAMLAAPPFPAWPLMLVAFVPMLLAQHRVLPARWSAAAPGIAIGFWFGSQLLPGLVEANVEFVFQLMPVYMGLVVAALSWRTRRFHQETGYRWFTVATPVAWVAIDFLRGAGNAALGGTWGNPVYAFWSQPRLLQPISIFGSYGFELLLLIMNWAIAGLLLAPRPRALRSAALAGAAAGLWVVASLTLWNSAPGTVRVAAIQPGPGNAEDEFRNDVAQTREAAAAGAQLVVWREAGLPFDPRNENRDELGKLARETGVHLVAGFATTNPEGRLNMAAVFAPDGSIIGTYGKDHPGTFAGDFSDVQAGHPVWKTSTGRLAVIICYDLDFTDTARYMARGGAQIVAVPSNDSVPSLAQTHYTHLVFRAIENRVSLVKADKMRDAAAIDPWGRVVEKVVDPSGRRSTLIADLPLGTHDSLSVRWGDWIGWLCVATLAVFVAASGLQRIRAHHT